MKWLEDANRWRKSSGDGSPTIPLEDSGRTLSHPLLTSVHHRPAPLKQSVGDPVDFAVGLCNVPQFENVPQACILATGANGLA